VLSQFIRFPGEMHPPLPIVDSTRAYERWELGPNDGGIKRGDREDTGDEEARPDEMGSGYAQPTVDPTSFGGESSIRHPASDQFDPKSEIGETDGMEVMEPTDGRLGLTDVGKKPADDWAADTGPTRTPESGNRR
jgi:hypothetical protein